MEYIYFVTEFVKILFFLILVDSHLSDVDLTVLPHREGFFIFPLLDKELF